MSHHWTPFGNRFRSMCNKNGNFFYLYCIYNHRVSILRKEGWPGLSIYVNKSKVKSSKPHLIVLYVWILPEHRHIFQNSLLPTEPHDSPFFLQRRELDTCSTSDLHLHINLLHFAVRITMISLFPTTFTTTITSLVNGTRKHFNEGRHF